jgi:hypothetical protein
MSRAHSLAERHPEHADDITLFAARDPVGNGKYLAWATGVLVAERALAPEIADVVDLFHKHKPDRHLHAAPSHPPARLLRPDLYSYKPHEFSSLRDTLLALQRKQDRKRARIEKRYRLVGELDAQVVYESDALLVRQIRNKNASVHYGLGTRWCIAMKGARYFEDYDANNIVFFFLTRKGETKGDRFDRVAIAYKRDERNVPIDLSYTDAIDEPTSDMDLLRALGDEFVEVQRRCYRAVLAWPPSLMASLRNGTITPEAARAVYQTVKSGPRRVDAYAALLSIVCAEATPADVLRRIVADAPRILKRCPRRFRRHGWWRPDGERDRYKVLCAAIFAHPATPTAFAVELGLTLRRRNVDTATIKVTGLDVEWSRYRGPRYRRRRPWRRYPATVHQAQRLVDHYEASLRCAKRKLARLKREKRRAAASATAKHRKRSAR